MRIFIIPLLALSSLTAYAVDGDNGTKPAEVKAMNTTCPVDGKPIDPNIAPVPVTVYMACCSQQCADEVRKNPAVYFEKLYYQKPWSKKTMGSP